MKVLLINLCIRRDTSKKIYPVGLGYVASAIYTAGYSLDIVDVDIHRYSDEELEGVLRKKDFDVVGFGCIVTGYKVVKNLCSMIKRINKNAIIIVGNSVAASIPQLLLSKTEADIAVIGEGDVTIVDLLKCIERKKPLDEVEGIYFKSNNKIIANKPRPPIANLDTIPLPKWDLFETDVYVRESKNFVSEPYPIPKKEIKVFPVNTARGCVYKCTFCYHVFRENRYRWRSPSSVIKEIKELKKLYGINYINFWDELTFFAKKQAEELIDKIIEEDLDIYWTASCRADLFKEDNLELVKKIKKSGCVGLGYSLESANEDILKSMNKFIKTEDFLRQKKILDKAGIVTWTSLVFGYPEETEETIRETMGFCYENNIYPSVGYLLPQPGSPMYQYIIDKRLIADEEEYLLSMGDRQDLRLNLTNVPSERFKFLIREYLGKINKKLGFNIPEDKLIKVGHCKAAPKASDAG
ncbi:MAG: radical SAM protein [Candidatus Omnitrophota bacterium]|nr:radical SAM protein [Candidatus Omnitrophota bacterium]